MRTKDAGVERVGYTVREYGEMVPLSRNGIYQGIAAGEIKAIRIGKKLIIPASEIDRLR